ncbi:RES family NAD+ phosphorylase [Aequorivita lipolytica]|uniref:RES family NAD+ phosphorylase n=1 Tax=Aequorivita lipolytica TaxID=153267 RepID=UPI000DBBEEA8|nr:RES family NAD+ phosphorylase [Aequorivita lipolytica]SRX53150.1 hypothetical protein AEQU2_02378 [Aequorivita lipolytica]
MRIFRISKIQYIDDFSGEGARLYGGRWNRAGDSMLYFSENLSLSLLEIIVHVEFADLPLDYSFVEVEIPDKAIKTIQSVDFLKPKWTTEKAVNQLQMLGSAWLGKKESLAMRVPSAVLNQENNILINPSHKDFEKLKVIKKAKMNLDPRLFR